MTVKVLPRSGVPVNATDLSWRDHRVVEAEARTVRYVEGVESAGLRQVAPLTRVEFLRRTASHAGLRWYDQARLPLESIHDP